MAKLSDAIRLSALATALAAATTSFAADFPLTGGGSPGASASIYAPSSSAIYAPSSTASAWYPGGNHWRGHHSLSHSYVSPEFTFTTPGWGAAWSYSPHEPYAPQRPVVAVAEPWTADWYAYCSQRYRSFDPGTGLYTTYSGERALCR